VQRERRLDGSRVFDLPTDGFSADAVPDSGMWLAIATQEPRTGG
jgi:hypothetical protein